MASSFIQGLQASSLCFGLTSSGVCVCWSEKVQGGHRACPLSKEEASFRCRQAVCSCLLPIYRTKACSTSKQARAPLGRTVSGLC